MPDIKSSSKNKAFGLAIWLSAFFCAESVWAEPARVVSVNLCTDQMAMLLAPAEQLVSVSFLAREPQVSAMAQEAKSFETNRGGLEEIISLEPDLVLAHDWTPQSLTAGLERFGIKVVRFSTPQSLAEIPDFILKMGTVLGREKEASGLVDDFQNRRNDLEQQAAKGRLHSLLSYSENGWVSSENAILNEAMDLAGFVNAGDALGFGAGGFMPLEVLVIAKPDVIVMPLSYSGSSRANTLLAHPALAGIDSQIATLENGVGFGCGLPLSLDGVAELQALKVRLN